MGRGFRIKMRIRRFTRRHPWLTFTVRSFMIFSAAFGGAYGFIAGSRSEDSGYDPHAFAIGASFLFAVACVALATLSMRLRWMNRKLRKIALHNEALADRPAGMNVTTHMCRGNFRSSWVAEGSYDFVAEALLNELAVDGYFMEWDDERSGGFEPLRFLPKGEKRVVLGLVTTKKGELESKDELKRRIEEAAKYAPLEQLCLSPQCGFSSTSEGNSLTEEEQWAKLRLIVEVADEVWGDSYN